MKLEKYSHFPEIKLHSNKNMKKENFLILIPSEICDFELDVSVGNLKITNQMTTSQITENPWI